MKVNPSHIQFDTFMYDLKDEQIAKYPLKDRDQSNLLIWTPDMLKHDVFNHIDRYLNADDLMVFNDTKVIRARILFNKATGAAIEIFCLEPYKPAEYTQSFMQTRACEWKCMVGNMKKWKSGTLEKEIKIGDETIFLVAQKVKDMEGKHIIRFTWEGDNTFARVIEQAGVIPIPPYLKRPTERIDHARYQTIYSRHKGSVAAPTAGLHFTNHVMHALQQQGIRFENITLHVGAGTFAPVKSNDISNHQMHTEHYSVTRSAIENLVSNGCDIIAVGTTTLRTLESLYWSGMKLLNKHEQPHHVNQWEPSYHENEVDVAASLEAVLDYMEKERCDVFHGSTRLMIVPGYSFSMAKGLVTNFHQPRSTLLLLVAAFTGNDEWEKIYDYAMNHNFRFLSYGDSSLLLPGR